MRPSFDDEVRAAVRYERLLVLKAALTLVLVAAVAALHLLLTR